MRPQSLLLTETRPTTVPGPSPPLCLLTHVERDPWTSLPCRVPLSSPPLVLHSSGSSVPAPVYGESLRGKTRLKPFDPVEPTVKYVDDDLSSPEGPS